MPSNLSHTRTYRDNLKLWQELRGSFLHSQRNLACNRPTVGKWPNNHTSEGQSFVCGWLNDTCMQHVWHNLSIFADALTTITPMTIIVSATIAVVDNIPKAEQWAHPLTKGRGMVGPTMNSLDCWDRTHTHTQHTNSSSTVHSETHSVVLWGATMSSV